MADDAFPEPSLRVDVTYHAEEWSADDRGGRSPQRGVYRARLSGFSVAEGTGRDLVQAVERLAAELMAVADAEDCRVYLDTDEPDDVARLVERLGRRGELVDALLTAAGEPVLQEDLADLIDGDLQEPPGADAL